MFRLQITALNTTIWCSAGTLETSVLAEAIQVADRMALACRRAAPPSRAAIRTWVVSVVGEAGGTLYQAPVAYQ